MLKRAIQKYKEMPVPVRAALWFFVCSFIQKGITTVTTPIFTRILTPDEYGEFQVFNSWFGIVSVFVTLNLSAGVYMQGLVKYEKERKEYSSSLQGLTFLLVCAWTAIYLLFHNTWNNLFSLTTVQMLAMLLMTWTSSVCAFWCSAQRVEFRYRKMVILSLLVSFAKPIVGIVLIGTFENNKVTARILGLVAVEFVFYVGLFISQMRQGKIFYSGRFWKHAILFNLPLIPHYLSMTVLNSSDRIMIKNMVGNDAAGIYSLAYAVAQLMTLFSNAIQQTLEPWRYGKIKSDRPEDIAKMAYPTLILIAVLNLLLMAFAPEIVTIFAPIEYHDAIWVIPPVCMSTFFVFSYGYFAVFEFYFEKTKHIMLATTVGAVLNIVLNYIFINMFGYYAAGYTTLLCYIVYAAMHYCFMQKISKQKFGTTKIYDLKIMLGIAAVFMSAGFLLLATYTNTLCRYLVIMILVVCIILKRRWLGNIISDVINIKRSKNE